jgi:hypothetical protein
MMVTNLVFYGRQQMDEDEYLAFKRRLLQMLERQLARAAGDAGSP